MRLVYTVTSGRSGTHLLTNLFRGLPGITAVHEPRPGYLSATLALQKDPLYAEWFLKNTKLPAVFEHKTRVYLETSHYVCKGFLEPHIKLGYYPDLIFLKRDPRKIACSWFLLGHDFFKKKEAVLRHTLHPEDHRTLYFPLPNWKEFNNYQLCYWYALEAQARIAFYKLFARNFGLNGFETSLEALTETEGEIFTLAEWLGIPLNDKIREHLTKRLSMPADQGMQSIKEGGRKEELASLDLGTLEKPVENARKIALNAF